MEEAEREIPFLYKFCIVICLPTTVCAGEYYILTSSSLLPSYTGAAPAAAKDVTHRAVIVLTWLSVAGGLTQTGRGEKGPSLCVL